MGLIRTSVTTKKKRKESKAHKMLKQHIIMSYKQNFFFCVCCNSIVVFCD